MLNPLPTLTNDEYMRHEFPYVHKNSYGGLILGVNTLYRLFCFFKLFPMVGKGLIVYMYICIQLHMIIILAKQTISSVINYDTLLLQP